MSKFAYYLMKLKHLPGQHNQQAHGSGGGRGSGGGGAIIANQQKAYDVLVDELQNGVDGKLFSQFGDPSASKYIANHNNQVLRELSNLDVDTQQNIIDSITADTISNPVHIQSAVGLSLFGATPELRQQAAELLNRVDATAYATMYPVTYGGGYGGNTTGYIKPTDTLSARQFYESNSIDHILATNPDTFPETMWKIHTDGKYAVQSVALSGMADILSQVGPNRGYAPEHSFYAPGVKAPTPDPRAVALMQQHYEATQQALKDAGIDSVELYRGGPLQPGITIEPWTTSRREATDWADRGKTLAGVYQFRTATIPREYIMNWYQNPNESRVYENDFGGTYMENRIYTASEQEYTVAGLGYANGDAFQSESVVRK